MFFSPSSSSSSSKGKNAQSQKTTLICSLPHGCPPLVLNVPSSISVDQALVEIKRKSDSYYPSNALPTCNKLKMQVQVSEEVIANVFGDDLIGEVFQASPASCILALTDGNNKRKANTRPTTSAPAKKKKTSNGTAAPAAGTGKSPKKKEKD